VTTEKWDAAAINSRTSRAELRIAVQREWLDNVRLDPQRKHRLESRKCVVCFYTSRVCGQGFSPYGCKMCKQDNMHHNTCIPTLCLRCARENNLCQQCGADMELALR
jgi:hypothetical protein